MNKDWKYFKSHNYDTHILYRYTEIEDNHYINLQYYNVEENKWTGWSNELSHNEILPNDIKINKLEVFNLIANNKVY